MDKVEKALEILSANPIRDSYVIAKLQEEDIDIHIDGRGIAVVVKSDWSISMRGRKEGLEDLLKDIGEGEYHFHSIDPNAFEAAQEVVMDIEDRPTWMMRRPIEKSRPPDLEVDELKIDDAAVVDRYWGLGGDDSTDYIAERIERGPAYGVRREGDWVGWCLTHYITDKALSLGILYVKEGWRGQGFAKSLTNAICEDAAQEDLVPIVDIFKDNEKSISLAEDLDFERIGENHWFSGKIP